MIDSIYLKNFTVFRELELPVSPGINVIIGDNGTGKTHLLKAAYACTAWENRSTGRFSRSHYNQSDISFKLAADFMLRGPEIGRLVSRAAIGRAANQQPIADAEIRVKRGPDQYGLKFTSGGVSDGAEWPVNKDGVKGNAVVFIPEKEILANAPGFVSLYELYQIHFEEIYKDIIIKAGSPPLRELNDIKTKLLKKIQEKIGGKVEVENSDTFFLVTNEEKLEFSLVATGMRKLGLLWLLIRNGLLGNGATLLWDEPEANLNPSMLEAVVDILLELQRHGVQIFLATHDYVLLKLLELKREKQDALQFISLSKNSNTDDIEVARGKHYTDILPNKIAESYSNIYDLDLKRNFGGAS